MALSASALASAIQDKFDALTDSIDWAGGEKPEAGAYNQEFDSALKSYLEDNLEVRYSWGATNPSGSPDPATSFTAHITYSSFDIGTPDSFSAWGAMIKDVVVAGSVLPDDASFVLPAMKLNSGVPLVLVQGGDLENICSQICTWIKTCVNPTPVAGVHGAFTVPSPGATMVQIL